MLDLALGPLLKFSLVLLICGFRAVRGTSLILGNAGSMLVHAHDGDIDHLPAPIATNATDAAAIRSATRLTSAFNRRVPTPFQFFSPM
ncbi:hypothetical protein JJC00_26895 [Bradyrhizobium diazoefficiens]|uniref:hypothetical protein n=1 Tax=Bradyrhizobium diazoefficiens TaxID=1355477 RepID=UPI00190A6F15|nr:hypothetical protein [Bradyrhizobium diazoefficiens]QQO32186.1 hypothetical protein JJC00_26895 [Bradyrhizobium diazoefficiens]